MKIVADINAQITAAELKILKISRVPRTPNKVRLCISERLHHDKRTQLRSPSQNRGHPPNFFF